MLDETRWSGVFGVADYESEKKDFEFQNGGSNITDHNAKSYLFSMKLGTQEFLRALITNLNTKFENLKWRIKLIKLLDSDETR